MNAKRSRVWAAFTLVLALILSGVLGATVARADQNAGIVVKVTELFRVDDSGVPTTDPQLKQGGKARIKFEYDASNANPQPGDSFSLGLPSVFKFLEPGATRDLIFQGVKVGECALTQTEMTCAFNDGIVGKQQISGAGELSISVVAGSSSATIDFDANGKQQAVPVPGGSILEVVVNFKYRASMGKNTNPSVTSAEKFPWNFVFNPSHAAMQDVVPGAPNAVTEVRFIDTTIVPGGTDALHHFVQDNKAWRLNKLDSLGDTKSTTTALADLDGPLKTDLGTFSLEVKYTAFDAQGRPITAQIIAKGPFQPDTNYQVRYDTAPSNETGKALAGFEYGNTVSLDHDGATWTAYNKTVAVDSFKVSITMQDGFGGFEVLKKVQGTGQAKVAAGTTFTVSAAWTLPNGKSPSDYPGWTAPANPVTLPIELGKTTTYDGTFPVGTQIVLSEDANTASPAADVVWGAPAMKVGSSTGETATFTIENQKSTLVDVTNTANKRPAVSVGDYAWFDSNGNGLQDATDMPLKGVTMTLTGPDGGQVRDLNGNVVAPVATGDDGSYRFSNLPALAPGQHYTVTVTAPEGYVPTRAGAGDDRSKDSSTGSATSAELTTDGASDLTLDFGFIKGSVSVGDFVWEDRNKDGLQGADEPGIKGVELKLTGPDGGPVTDVTGREVANTTTNDNGEYSFDGLPIPRAGQSYTVTVVTPPAGFVPTQVVDAPRDKNSSTGSATSEGLTKDTDRDETLDFGFVRAAVSVGDYVFFDVNGDGVQDDTDRPIEGAVLKIAGPDGGAVTDINGQAVAEVTTDAQGKYLFANLPVLAAGEKYTVSVVSVPGDFQPTKAKVGDDRAADSSTAQESSGDLTTDGASDLTLDFGFVRPAVSVGDFVFFDVNGDGVQDDTDRPIQGVTLKVTDENGDPVEDIYGNEVAPVTTDEKGYYSFAQLPVQADGHYTVRIVEVPGDYLPTTAGAGDDRAKDSSTDSADSSALPNDGDRDDTLDFGFVRASVSVGDLVWLDANANGIQDAGEQPIQGVKLTLTAPDGKAVTDVFGNPVAPVVTDAAGKYSFDNLVVLGEGQSYRVSVETPAGYKPTKSGAGERGVDSSTFFADSEGLTAAGQRDDTLDFGLVKLTKPGLPKTGV